MQNLIKIYKKNSADHICRLIHNWQEKTSMKYNLFSYLS